MSKKAYLKSFGWTINIKILVLCIICNLWFVSWDSAAFKDVYALNLSRAETLYLQRSYGDSIDECAKAISEGGKSDFAYYLLGLNYLKLNDTDKSREKLQYLLDKFKASKYYSAAKLVYADTFFLDQDYSKAKYNYETLLKQPGSLNSTLYLRLGQCALKTGNWQEAKDYFNILKKNFPLSMEAIQADSLAQTGDYFFTVQAGCFANSVNAGRFLSKLKNKNFDAYIDEMNSPEGKLYRVRVGKLKSRQEAESLKDALEKEGYPTRIFP